SKTPSSTSPSIRPIGSGSSCPEFKPHPEPSPGPAPFIKILRDRYTGGAVGLQNIVSQDAANACQNKLYLVFSFYMVLIVGVSMWFYEKFESIKAFTVFLLVQFFLLQAPFFIWHINGACDSVADGQQIMEVLSSSPKASFTLILFGVIFDRINRPSGNKGS
ncbi:MAG: hypothetical protein ABEH43_03055, partial [Flavobacteriales bacterium]